jgi:acyl-homoserine-lactone acylase
VERAAHGGANHHAVQSEEWLDPEHEQLAVHGAGAYSPRQSDYPAYMSVYGENARGLHAVKVFQNQKDFTIDKLIAASYDSELTAFEALLPPLFAAYDALPAGGAQSWRWPTGALLRAWDCAMRWTRPPRWRLWGRTGRTGWKTGAQAGRACWDFMATDKVSAEQRLAALATAAGKLQRDFGNWQTRGARSTASSA